MYLLLILGACFCGGLSDTERYGDYFSMVLSSRAQYIEFTRIETGETSIIWRRNEPSSDRRQYVTYFTFKLKNLTQEDSGLYTQRDKDGTAVVVKTLSVEAKTLSRKRKAGDTFKLSYDLHPSSCNIYFIPENDKGRTDEIVHHGTAQYHTHCLGFEVSQPCGITFNSLDVSCGGQFIVRDSNGNTALEVSLEVEGHSKNTHTYKAEEEEEERSRGTKTRTERQGSSFDTKKIGWGLGIASAILSCCGCLRHCCCGKSKTEEETPENEDAPPTYYHECGENDPNEPGAESLNPLSETPSDTIYPSQPSYNSTGPLIHEPPTSLPPPYSEVFGLAEPAGASSVSEPRFELKGVNFSASSDVYTSDKLDFLSKP